MRRYDAQGVKFGYFEQVLEEARQDIDNVFGNRDNCFGGGLTFPSEGGFWETQ